MVSFFLLVNSISYRHLRRVEDELRGKKLLMENIQQRSGIYYQGLCQSKASS
jgi:hypothetical protein